MNIRYCGSDMEHISKSDSITAVFADAYDKTYTVARKIRSFVTTPEARKTGLISAGFALSATSIITGCEIASKLENYGLTLKPLLYASSPQDALTWILVFVPMFAQAAAGLATMLYATEMNRQPLQ
jgi:hypothetical protein